MQTSLVIRCATSGDVALMERFIIYIANFHGDTNTDNPTAIMRNLFGPTSSLQASCGEDDNQPVAFAICYTEYGGTAASVPCICSVSLRSIVARAPQNRYSRI